MSAETVTLVIHREMPGDRTPCYLLAKRSGHPVNLWDADTVRREWEKFQWWSEIPAPVKPKRFVVEKHCGDGLGAPYAVKDTQFCNMTAAFAIPTREAAQRIADIYEEATP